ncbi:nuclear factor related to kappa-B-binding protein-like isoform X3 [Pieris napi]|uniref:nuclear factor related to kappa-B-binding protein-like isoform X3 n=1 Tax=Pieris napi TaxID=78633 RepID=UPI001FBAAF87|nr:nuclear factor related to kappa-B-binding protein-like isoform X3 [Pieris napi]
MEEKVDSDQSFSEESSSSSSDSSSESSESDEEIMEQVRILGHTLELPQDLCEDPALFKEFFSMKTWDSLADKHKDQLKELLPKFEENDEEEKQTTLKMLLSHEPFHFTSPLTCFFKNLRQGNYRPDIARMRKFLTKARAKQQRHKIKSYYAKLLPEVLISRERLLAVAKSSPPGLIPPIPLLPPKPSSKNNYKPMYVRARHRYFEELTAIWSEVGCQGSDDENYPEGPPEHFSKRRKRNNAVQTQSADSNVSGTLGTGELVLPSLACLKNVLSTHRARRQHRETHPELNTTGITLDDIKQRVSLMNGAKKLMFGGPKAEIPIQKVRKGIKREQHRGKDFKQPQKKTKDDENSENKLLPHIKIKCEQEESDSESSFFEQTSPRQKKVMDHVDIKQEVDSENQNSRFDLHEKTIKKEPQDSQSNSKTNQPVPIKLEDLDGIDMMALPVELADETMDSPKSPDEALTETTHANFLSLVRALFPAKSAHRASKRELQARCSAVMRSPIAPLNTWYNLSNDWCAELNSALDFLAGERGPHPDDFVPYLQFIPDTQMYQWIGAGRDCDAILNRLCERWMRAATPTPQQPDAPPPPRYPTNWIVRQPTNTEIAEFRSQERRRFASASKPFTYLQYGYRSVVGPASGVRASAGGACTSLVTPQRPRAAGFLALLRDALARLPNGEGTRRDLLMLLKMSQWIIPCTDQALSSAISMALDRLVAIKRDPIVKYDQRTAIWTYLHRNRTEEDWLKCSNARSRAIKSISTDPSPSPKTPVNVNHMEVEVGSGDDIQLDGSDTDVDVDDSGSSANLCQLSSAQLLMQATQAQTKPKTPSPKVKPSHKPKIIKQISPKALKINQIKQKSLLAQKLKNSKLIKPIPKSPKPPIQSPKSLTSPRTTASPKPGVPSPKPSVSSPKPSVASPKPSVASPKPSVASPKPSVASPKPSVSSPKPIQKPQSKSMLSNELNAARTPIVKQKSISKIDTSQIMTLPTSTLPSSISVPTLIQTNVMTSMQQNTIIQNPKAQVTRSLLIRPPVVHTTATVTAVTVCTPSTQVVSSARRGVVRVLSPATAAGKSLISPRALMPQPATTTAKKRPSLPSTAVATTLQSTTVTNVVSSVTTPVTSSITTRTVQLPGGRTVQLSNQTVQLAGGQSVQLSGHTLQLSSLQLPTHSVRLPSGQTVQLASPQTVQAIRAVNQKNQNPRAQTPTVRPTVQIPVSSVQLAGQTVQIGGQTVQLGQSVQLTGHTVKLPSGQSVQVASQNVLPTQSVQLPSGQTVQLGGNVQSMLSGQNVQLSNQISTQLGTQTVQLGNQIQLSGQTVQLPSGQTLQLSGQTVQLSSGQTLQLASGQTLQLNQTPKSIAQVRNQAAGDKQPHPIVAKLLTNAQGQMISLEGVMNRNMSGVVGVGSGRGRGVRVLSPTTRLTRPVLLTSGKPLHNIILQSDGNAIRVPVSSGAATSQTIVISSIGAQSANTTTTTAPVLKLQQVNPIQQVKLAQGIKIQQGSVANTSVATSSGIRSVVMDGQHLKLVGGRHVLARLLRPANPQQ